MHAWLKLLVGACLSSLSSSTFAFQVLSSSTFAMGWQYNWMGSDEELHGWLWVEGKWTWGAVITYHIVNVSAATPGVLTYYWVCTIWSWNRWKDKWYPQIAHSLKADAGKIEGWMVHPLQNVAHNHFITMDAVIHSDAYRPT
jgi:hypothetical protein